MVVAAAVEMASRIDEMVGTSRRANRLPCEVVKGLAVDAGVNVNAGWVQLV